MSDSNDKGGKVIQVDFAARRAQAKPPAADMHANRPSSSPESITTEFRKPGKPLDGSDETKLEAFTRLVDRGLVLLTLDGRRHDVRLPVQFRDQAQVALSFSHRFGIGDFTYRADGVRATLSFAKRPFYCEIPWEAVYMLRSDVADELIVWPDSLPPEVSERLPPQIQPQKKKPVLAAVPDPDDDPDAQDEADENDAHDENDEHDNKDRDDR
jgi:hypothetical protein